MDWQYINERVKRYNSAKTTSDRDDLLYRIGTHADLLNPEEAPDGNLTAEQRCRVLEWLIYEAKAFIDGNLTLLIFGVPQLKEWQRRSEEAYPDFALAIAIRQSDLMPHLEFSLHFDPLPGAPEVDPETDFPYRPFWDCAEMFWGHFPNNCTNEFDFILDCYPCQASFAVPGSLMQNVTVRQPDFDDLFLIDDLLGLFALTYRE